MDAIVTPINPEQPEQPAQTEPKRRTVTLTNRCPVSIVEKEWPVVGEGSYVDEHPSGCEEVKIEFRVRAGKYDRHLIHGNFNYWLEDVNNESVRVGRLLHRNESVDKALLEVGNEMLERVSSEPLRKLITIALDRCFASLGPQVL